MARALLGAGLLALLRGAAGHQPSEAEIQAMWKRFQVQFGRQYADDAAERLLAFRSNVLQALELNRAQGVDCTDLFDGPHCVFGITKFSDMSQEEFASTHLGYKPSRKQGRSTVPVVDSAELPEAASTVDWRTKGAVTQVKDQGQCGSCWAFSATEEIESAVFMATGQLKELSTQQIISCDRVDEGCNGGNTETAYEYVEKVGGLDSASDYPDQSHVSGRTGTCSWDKQTASKVSGYSYAVKPCKSGACRNQDEDGLAAVLAAKGPISICVNAGGNAWQLYKRGVFKTTCSGAASQLDHCVQLVGYDKTGATPYWLVRNSWNTDWGIDGYMHLEMGRNLCGVADEATLVQASPSGSEIVV